MSLAVKLILILIAIAQKTKLTNSIFFFSSVGENTFKKNQEIIHGENVPHPTPVRENLDGDAVFRSHPVGTETVILTIKILYETSLVGSDGIPVKFIKDALYVIAFYLTCIVYTSVVTGIVPTAWKHVLAIPLSKSGDVSDFNNFRPVSLLLIISKVLEKIVANQLTHVLETKKLLSNSQHGFRSKLSTETAVSLSSQTKYTAVWTLRKCLF